MIFITILTIIPNNLFRIYLQLFYINFQQMIKPEITLAVIGSARVGKSAMMIRFAENVYTEYYLPTKQAVIKVKELHYDNYKQSINVKIWDIGNDEKIKKEVYQKIDGFIIMYDITNSQSFLDLDLHQQGIYYSIIEINELSRKDVAKIIVGNKKDKKERQVQFEQGKDFADQLKLEFIETSVLTTENLWQT
ncbi:hypothetical protein pb186bvf_001948 [Paramecium bursaria]